jgi:flagellin
MRSNNDLQQSMQRLSTGLRINSGKDDPAGLIASENLRRDITAVNKAISNSERAAQMIATSDSALGQVSSLLNDIRGLITEAANSGAMSEEQIAANQLQVDSSLQAIDRIAQTTTFQGRKLLDGSLDFLVQGSSGYTTVADLKINQANLGQLGTVDVDIKISTAATQAELTNAIPDSAAGQITLGEQTFTINTDPASGLSSVGVALAVNSGPEATGTVEIDGHDFTITAADGQAIDAVDVNVVADDLEVTGELTLDNTVFTIDGAEDTTFDDVTVSVTKSSDFEASGTTITLDDGASQMTLDIAAVDGQAADNTDNITVRVTNTAAGNSASYAAGVLTINLSTGDGVIDTTDITNAFAVDGDFTVSNFGGAAALDGGTGSVVEGDIDTLTSEDLSVDFSNNTLAITLNDQKTSIDGATIQAALDALPDFTVGAPTGSTNVMLVNVSDDPNAATLERPSVTAGFAANTLTLTFDDQQSEIDVNDVIAAIDELTEFNGTTTTAAANSTINGTALAAGPTTVGTLDRINGVVADFDSDTNVLTLTFDGEDTAVTAATVIAAIDGLADFTGTTATGSGDIDATTLTPTASLTTAGRIQDLVVRIAGEIGSEVFTFQAGTTFDEIANAIELVSDATGVSAEVVGSQLTLTSTNYGGRAFIDVEVISEGDGGTFADNLSGTRAEGTDIVATVNGAQASGDGNILSVRTATLDMTMTVGDGSDTDVSFTINGGGAIFQVGPDVVSNQQARIGIDSVVTGKLGGSAGRLYELRSGNTRALANDANGAATIVDQAITKVAELRGRLGAFQRTTLETNIASLADTLVNLTEAQSGIRDADFARESAALTRSQILVQSGTAVLAIANQNPQNVLALLR